MQNIFSNSWYFKLFFHHLCATSSKSKIQRREQYLRHKVLQKLQISIWDTLGRAHPIKPMRKLPKCGFFTCSFYRRDRASLNYSISILLVWRKMLTSFMYGPVQANLVVTTYASSEGSGDPAPRQNLSCSLKQAMSQEEPSDRKPDPWPLWMTGHEQLKFFMTKNARRHKFAWRGPYSCASVNNNKKMCYRKIWKWTKVCFMGKNVYFYRCLYEHDKWCW